MSKIEKLLAAMRNNPANVRHSDLIRAAVANGFVLRRQDGSHAIYTRGADFLNIQNDGGKAKAYQVRQFLKYLGE